MRKTVHHLYAIAVDLLVFSCPLSVYRVIASPFSADIFEMYVTPAIFWTDLFSALVILLGVANLVLGAGRKFSLKPLISDLFPFSGIVLLSFISIVGSISKPLAGYYATRLLFNSLLLWVLINNPFNLKRVAWVFTLSMLCHAVVGMAQFIHHGPLGLPGEMALEIEQVGAARIAVSGSRWLRAYGLTFHPNVLGGFLTVALILSLPFLKRWWAQIIWSLLLAGFILTFSRSAWLAAGLVLPVLYIWVFTHKPQYRRPLASLFILIVLVVVLSIVLLFGQVITRLQFTQTFSEFSSLYERGQLIGIALDVIADDPFTGIGVGNFPLAVLRTLNPIKPHHVHNVPLLLASECGLLAGILWYILWLKPLVNVRSHWIQARLWPVVFAGAWFAFGVIALWDSYPWSLESGRVLSMILLAGLCQSLIQSFDHEKNDLGVVALVDP